MIQVNSYNDLIDNICDENIKEFTKSAIDKFGSEELENDTIQLTKWLIFLLKEDKILNDNNYAVFVDVLIAAAALHNITYKYNEEDYTKVFKARQLLSNEDFAANLNKSYFDLIFQTVECQLGKQNPISLLIPNPNSPSSQFSLACALYYKTHNTISDEDLY